jgi:hypothetical protein
LIEALVTLCITLIKVTLLTILFLLPGSVLTNISSLFSKSKPKVFVVSQESLILGFATVVLASYVFPRLGFPLFDVYIWILIVSFTGVIFLFLQGYRFEKNYSFWTQNFTLLLIAFFTVIPAVIFIRNFGTDFVTVSKGNNDVAFYIAAASEYLKHGFENSSHLEGYDLSSAASGLSWFSPITIFTLLASFLGSGIWKEGLAALLFCNYIAISGLNHLFQTLSPNLTRNFRGVLVAVVAFTPLQMYIFANNYLAQTLSVGISAFLVSYLILSLSHDNKQIVGKSTIAPLVLLAVFTYPQILILIAGLAIISFGLILIASKFDKDLVKQWIWITVYFVLGLIFSIPYLPTAINILRAVSSGGFGFPLPSIEPVGILISPTVLGYTFPNLFVVISWIITLSLYFWSLQNHRGRSRSFLILFSILMLLTYTLLVPLRSKGMSEYNSWKLISYFAPFFIVFFLVSTIQKKSFKVTGIFVMFGILCTVPIQIWDSSKGKTQYTTASMDGLSKDVTLNNLKSLNIDVEPFFETMILTSVLENPKLFLRSHSYFPMSFNQDACTLFRNGNPNYNTKRILNSDYSLGSKPGELPCRLAQKFPEGKWFSMPDLSNYLIDGWSYAENWGVWSQSDRARIEIPILNQCSEISQITVKLRVFGTASMNDSRKLSIFLNGILVSTQSALALKSETDITFGISCKDLLNELLSLEFMLPNLLSPRDLGESDDSRSLGVGLISFKFD